MDSWSLVTTDKGEFPYGYRKSTIIDCMGQGAWEPEAIDDTRGLDY